MSQNAQMQMGLGRTSLWSDIKAALREGPAEQFLVACSQLSSHLSLALQVSGSLSPAPSLGAELRGQEGRAALGVYKCGARRVLGQLINQGL